MKAHIPVCRGHRSLHHASLPQQTPPAEKKKQHTDDESVVLKNTLQRHLQFLNSQHRPARTSESCTRWIHSPCWSSCFYASLWNVSAGEEEEEEKGEGQGMCVRDWGGWYHRSVNITCKRISLEARFPWLGHMSLVTVSVCNISCIFF